MHLYYVIFQDISQISQLPGWCPLLSLGAGKGFIASAGAERANSDIQRSWRNVSKKSESLCEIVSNFLNMLYIKVI